MTTPNTKKTAELLTVHEVAKILRVDASTVRRWIKVGVMKSVKLPSRPDQRGKYRIRRSTVDAVLNNKTQK